MASALLEKLKTVANEGMRNKMEDAGSRSRVAFAAEEHPLDRVIKTLQADAGSKGGGGGWKRKGRGGVGVKHKEQ